jgi:2'-5' RNA ligase
MPRLFIALELPRPVSSALTELLPRPAHGVRRIPAEQMHVTLHFIGQAEIEFIAQLLEQVRMQPFELLVAGVGQFSRAAVLWAGVKADAALMSLHGEIGKALQAGGVAIETRPYRPHITLARCKPQLPPEMVRDFLAQSGKLVLPAIPVSSFALYSSTPSAAGPVYRVERRFPAAPC